MFAEATEIGDSVAETIETGTDALATEFNAPLPTATEGQLNELSDNLVASEEPRDPKLHFNVKLAGVMLTVLTVTNSPPSVLTEDGDVEVVLGHAPETIHSPV